MYRLVLKMATGLWTVFLLDAAFILLSGASQEARRCYWCGPLAEQVHRSRRSGPCGAADHVTDCEPGYNYCAVVATSPPRVESRYCVKIYQDECYPLYCNTTNTWKMTCPCRGDLCNGANTERETEAFALLPKLVAKTRNARIKKRTANQGPHLKKHDGQNKIIDNGDAEMHNPSSKDVNNITNDNKLVVTENDYMSNKNSNSSQESENMQSDQPTNIVIEHHHNEENYAQSTIANEDNKLTTTKQLIEIEIHVSDPTEESNKMKENDQPCTDLPTTTVLDEVEKNTEVVKNEVESKATTANSASNNESPIETTEVNIVVASEATKTTQVIQQDLIEIKPSNKPHTELPTKPAEIISNGQPMNPEEQLQNDAPEDVQQNVIDIKSTDKPHTEPPTKTTENMSNGQPMNPEEQMQNDAPPTSPADSIQILKTTEVAKNEEPAKDIAKANDGMPTAEALQQNGSPPATAAPVPMTEKPTEPTTTEATTVPTVMTSHKLMTNVTTTPASRRKNNDVRITFSYALLLICIGWVYQSQTTHQ